MKELLEQIPEWEIMPQDSIDRLTRIFKFDDYLEAVSFSNKVAELAEEEDHHPPGAEEEEEEEKKKKQRGRRRRRRRRSHTR